MRSRIKTGVVAVTVFLLAFTAGCDFNPFRTAKPSQQSTIGLVDMGQLIKSHPKYAELEKLQNEYNQMGQQLGASEQRPNGSNGNLERMNAANEEYSTRMQVKQNQISSQLQSTAKDVESQLSTELNAYAQELQKEYQSRIISLQLKKKTLELTKEQAEALQAEEDKLQKELSEKTDAKRQELAQKMNAIMSEKQANAKTEMDAYAQTLHSEIADKLQNGNDGANQKLSMSETGAQSDAERSLVFKQQEIKALQERIVTDIKDKVAILAAKMGLELVLTEAKVNVSAIDITSQAITEINK
ncbi:MAG: outer rane chaperone Skp (OmpH) [Firmicutes bacterium]|nr:outer rane chaperone Skp (OmpH) [Bacillota bacterium]